MKHIIYIAIVAATVLATAGCAKVGEIEVPEGQEITVTASFAEDNAKTTLQDGGTQVLWEVGDEINVFYEGTGSRFCSTLTEPSATSDFSGSLNFVFGVNEGVGGSKELFAVYPYRSDATSDGSSITTTLPAEQTGKAGSFAKDMNISLAKSSSFNMGFYNVCGGARFSLTRDGVKNIVFESLNGESIAGKVKLAFEGGTPAVQEIIEGVDSIILTTPSGDAFEAGKWYYIVVLPGTLSGGFKMTFNTDTGYAVLESTSSRTIKRGIFGSLANANEGLEYKDKDAPEAIDLGLSVKWATFNVGATKPEECGDYFAWGEIEPYYTDGHSHESPCTNWRNMTTGAGNTDLSNGYVQNSYYQNGSSSYSEWATPPYIQKDLVYNHDQHLESFVLKPDRDVATVKWGGGWRMPTHLELIELFKNTTQTWTTDYNGTGVSGYIVTSTVSGFSGNSIFLPAAGYRYEVNFGGLGTHGWYWCSNMRMGGLKTCANCLYIISDHFIYSYEDPRVFGNSVRPVLSNAISVTGVQLNTTSITLTEGENKTLAATVSPSDASDKNVTWSSSNISVATVDASGKVTAIEAGTATITVTTSDGGFTADCVVIVESSSPSSPEAVDLGLTVKWATCNLGASKPEEYGTYFAYGDVTGQTWNGSFWSGDGFSSFPTYELDENNNLKPEYDAAHVILGGTWRMPTKAEQQELIDNCTSTWTSDFKGTGVAGRVFTSNKTGYTDKSIFLPAAGCGNTSNLFNAGSIGYYWSSTFGYDDAWHLHFFSSNVGPYRIYRLYGLSVRPVYTELIHVTGISLNQSSISLDKGSTYSLTATITPENATNKNVIWSCSDESVASVSSDGVVTAVKVGSATITATSEDGEKTAVCTVNVKDKSGSNDDMDEEDYNW